MKYSIITVNLNNARGLEDTIQSVVNQTCRDYEFLIIDGGSSDNSTSIIEHYKNQIDYWISEPDNGIFNAMNKGIIASKGDYLIFMNSGDCFYNEKVLEESLQYLGPDFVIGQIKRKDDNTIMNYELGDISMMTFLSSMRTDLTVRFSVASFHTAIRSAKWAACWLSFSGFQK